MKKSLISLAVLAAMGAAAPVRARTHDVAFTFRMGGGFAGDVNRTHPASIEAGLQDVNDPVIAYGYPCQYDATDNTYRAFIATDDAVTTIAGVVVRPYPTQQTTGGMTASLGTAAPPVTGVLDVLSSGFILVHLENFAAANPVKGGPVYIWTAVDEAGHKLGGFEGSATGGKSTLAITNAVFNGPADANGIAELRVWPALRTAP